MAVLVLALGACGSSAKDETATPTSVAPGDTPTTSGAEPAAHPSPGCATAEAASTDPNVARTISVKGTDRSYLMAVPEDTAVPAPLIILLHGMGSSASDIDRVSDMPKRATAAGVIVVSPDAVGSPTMWRPAGEGPDADLLDALITEVEANHCVDTNRVAIAGFSVGAVFASVYGCTHQDRIASIVTVEVDVPGPCTRPMPILAFHGTADSVVPYAPPPGQQALGGGSGTEANMAEWAKISNCAPTPVTTEVGSEVARLEWPQCSGGSEVILFKIIGGGHDWPGKDPATAVHPSTQQVIATNEAIAFVERHSLTT